VRCTALGSWTEPHVDFVTLRTSCVTTIAIQYMVLTQSVTPVRNPLLAAEGRPSFCVLNKSDNSVYVCVPSVSL
jgi:hypothetical protein